ncbi:MAG: glycosyltransferase [Acidobacteriota bacterium]
MSILVVAPHFDDEVLGCGGLLAGRIAAGAVVRVLFLSDGGAEPPAGTTREDYAARRRAESIAAGELLGIDGSDCLELPDGALEQHLDAIAGGLRRALLSQRPDLLLVPSPFEVSADHRAAFAALHRLLAPLRAESDDPLLEVARALRVLAYEINRPLEPDLLVDVGDHLEGLERAMAAYASQQERHDYLGAALGLRSFRTLTLPAGVEAAEAYRRLRLDDFTTRGPSRLLEHLGAVARPRLVDERPTVSVVVRTKDRPQLLAEALESLAASTWRRLEVIVVNDGGETPRRPEDYPLSLRLVDLPENRGRAAAANAGVAAATGEYVAFLDDDDLVEPEHYEVLVGLVTGAGVRVAYTDAAVGVYVLGGSTLGRASAEEPASGESRAGWSCVERRLPYSRDFDPERLLVDNYIPFHTLLIERALCDEIEPVDGAVFDETLPFFEDWDFLLRLAARTPFHHLARVTCEYRQFRDAGHHVLGDHPRRRAEFLVGKAEVLARHRLGDEALARVVDALRAEAVEAAEDAAAVRRALASETERRHALNGELRASDEHRRVLEAIDARRGEELEGLRRELGELRAFADGQSDELAAAHREIGRLSALVDAMESTRAWRLHRTVEKLKGRGA